VLVLMNREEYVALYQEKKEAWRMRRLLGVEGYARHQEGFTIVNMQMVPAELNLAKLNERLAEKGYYVIQGGNKSLVDSSMECSIWFSESPAGADHLIQAFISIDMRDKNDRPIWTHLSTGAIRLRQSDSEPGKRESLLAAIDRLTLTDLPDGRALRHHGPRGVAEMAREKIQEKAESELEARISEYLCRLWIMSHRLHLVSGSTMDGIVLEHGKRLVSVKTPTGKIKIPANRIAKIERLDGTQLSQQIDKALEPLKKSFTEDWQHQVCIRMVGDLSERLAAYGPAYPEASVVRMEPGNDTVELIAVVRIDGKERAVKKNDKIAGFKVIGMDSETDSILLRMGEGGEVLRVWPEPASETG